MIKWTLGEVVEAIGGKPWGELSAVSVAGVSTDSRTAAVGDLFFAIAGDRFLYLANAALQGEDGLRPPPRGQRHVILELSLAPPQVQHEPTRPPESPPSEPPPQRRQPFRPPGKRR